MDNIDKLKRGDYVSFRYEGGFMDNQMKSVVGWVDKIEKTHIVVGNQSWMEVDGLSVNHTRKYYVGRIKSLEVRTETQ